MEKRLEPDRSRSSSRRSGRSHQAVLSATVGLFEELGYQRLTVDGIASRAGVSKATIYRWWPNKGAIVMEAFLTMVEPQIGFPDSGSVRDDLVSQLASLAQVLSETRLGTLMISLLGEAQSDSMLADAFRDGWLEPRRVAGRAVLRRAVDRGELREDLDLDVALDALYGPVYLRLLFNHAPLNIGALEDLVDHGLRGIRATR